MIAEILVFILIYWFAFLLGYLIAEKWQRPFGLFSPYPWRCRRCATTHIMTISYIVGGLIFNSWWFGGIGLIITIGQAIEFVYGDKEDGLR